MWLDRDDMRDFEACRDDANPRVRVIRHVPSGTEFVMAPHQSSREPERSFIITAGEAKARMVVVLMSSRVRAAHLGEPYKWFDEKYAFRKKYGDQYVVAKWADVDGADHLIVTSVLIDIAINCLFIYYDFNGFVSSKSPYPDVADFEPPEIPQNFHRKVVNHVPEGLS